jgi:carboxyl-terminal processing protease
MRRPRILLLVALATALAANLVVGYRVYAAEAEKAGDNEAFERIGAMMQVLYLIRKDYVNAEKVSYRDLVYNALHGMVRSLDPFSDFMPPDEYGSMMETTEGEFGGLGIIVSTKDEVLTIVSPIDDTPGSRAGLQAGDQILKIEGVPTLGMKLNDAIAKLRGEAGTKVTLTIRRPATNETRDYSIERASIPLYSVKDARVLPDTRIGYVRITQFSDPTAEELRKAMEKLDAVGVDSVVIDLRNNPGGLLPSAVEICSYFLEPDTLIVSTEGRQPSQKHEFRTQKRGYKFARKPVALLINGGSASAAEIMAGCLKDWGRAILVGEKTFGKGSVQNVIPLPDGSALRLTTAMYYTPSRQVIHEHGILPDVEEKLTMQVYAAVFESARPPGETPADRQLQRAVEVLRSYDVYLKGVQGKFKTLREPDQTAKVDEGTEGEAAKAEPAKAPPEDKQAPAEEKKR